MPIDTYTEDLVLPPEFSRRVYYTGMLASISVAIALHLGLYDFAVVAAAVLINSVNYWRHPVRGWRRNCDIFFATFACLYHMYASRYLTNHTYLISYWISILFALFSYAMAKHYDLEHDNPDRASKWHMKLHVFGNISNIILYYGLTS